MSQVFIGKRVQIVPHWQHPERNTMPKRYQFTHAHSPQMATVVAINLTHGHYTVRYDKSGLLETLKGRRANRGNVR